MITKQAGRNKAGPRLVRFRDSLSMIRVSSPHDPCSPIPTAPGDFFVCFACGHVIATNVHEAATVSDIIRLRHRWSNTIQVIASQAWITSLPREEGKERWPKRHRMPLDGAKNRRWSARERAGEGTRLTWTKQGQKRAKGARFVRSFLGSRHTGRGVRVARSCLIFALVRSLVPHETYRKLWTSRWYSFVRPALFLARSKSTTKL